MLRLDHPSPRRALAFGLEAPERALLESVTKLAVVDVASRADVRGVVEALLAVVAAPIPPVVDGGPLEDVRAPGRRATHGAVVHKCVNRLARADLALFGRQAQGV